MNRISLLAIIIAIILSSCKQNQRIETLEIVKGIPLKIATYRKQHYTNVSYELLFDIPENIKEKVHSKQTITVTINEISQPLIIDFNVDKTHLKEIKANKENIDIVHENEHIIIDKKYLKKGK